MSEPLIIRNVDSYNLDTREQLEADLEDMVRSWCADNTSVKATRGVIMFWQVKELLDRQAAITIRECTSEDESCCEACRAAQKRKIAELKAERDELREALDAYGLGQMYDLYEQKCKQVDDLKAKYDALLEDREKVWCDCDCCGWQEEREQMQRVIRTQAESFRKLEVELAMRDD